MKGRFPFNTVPPSVLWPAAVGLALIGTGCTSKPATVPEMTATGTAALRTAAVPARTTPPTDTAQNPGPFVQLTHCQGQCFFPAWSPNGTAIAYYSFGTNGTSAVMVMADDGGNPRLVTFKASGWAPVWSPDGKWIAFTDGQGGALYVSTLDGSQERHLSDTLFDPQLIPPYNLFIDLNYGWSPDGAALAYVSANPKESGLWVGDVQGNPAKQILVGAESMVFLGWLADGRIYVLIEEGGVPVLYAAAVDGSASKRLAELPPGAMDPAVSPDGTHIVFNVPGGEEFEGKFWLMTVGDSRKMILLPALVGSPAWSPDGTRIAFAYSEREGDEDIYIIRADGRGLTNLTRHTGYADTEPAWSRDGSRIAFVSRSYTEDGYCADDQVYIVEVPEG